MGEPPYNPMGDVGFSHVDDGAGQGDFKRTRAVLVSGLVNVRPRDYLYLFDPLDLHVRLNSLEGGCTTYTSG